MLQVGVRFAHQSRLALYLRPRLAHAEPRAAATPFAGIGTSAELGNALGLLEDHPGVVLASGARRLTLVVNARVRPKGNAQAAIATLPVAHDVTPLAVDVTVPVGEGHVVGVNGTVVTRTQDVADLVRNRNGNRRA